MSSHTQKIIVWSLLSICMLVLTKFILFKNSPGYYKHYFLHEYSRYTIKEGLKNANFHPFFTIRWVSASTTKSREFKIDNIGGNILGFIPLGFLFPFLLKKKKAFITIVAVFFISLLFEITQLLTGIGYFDVDDLMLNTLGGSIGFLFYLVFRKIAPATV